MRVNKVFKWSVIVALGGFLFGFDTAVISGVEKSVQKLFELSPILHGFAISSALIGTVLGAMFAGQPADRYGRRYVLFIVAAFYAVSAFGSALAGSLWPFVFFRFLGGLAVGASSVAGPMYISEISPAKDRGRLTALFQFNVIFGILIAFVSNYLLRDVGDEPWRVMLGVEGIPALLYFMLLFFIPRSPRYLIKIGELKEARGVLAIIETGDIEKEIGEIKAGLEKDNSLTHSFFSRHYFRPISLAILVAMFNQFSGINAILYYAPRIFEQTGLSSSDSLFQPVLIGIINGLFTLLGMAIIDKTGRKKLLIVGSAGMAVCLALTSRMMFYQDFSGYGLLIYLLVYIAFFAFSTGAVIWVLISEVFPNSVRGKGQALGSFTHWFFAALITFVFPLFTVTPESTGGIFAFFSLMMIVQMWVVWKFFPETKGKSLEELGEELSGNT